MSNDRLYVAAWKENPSVVLDQNFMELVPSLRSKAFGTTDLACDDFACVANEEQWNAAGTLPDGYALMPCDENPWLSVFFPNDIGQIRDKLDASTSYFGVDGWPVRHRRVRASVLFEMQSRFESLMATATWNNPVDEGGGDEDA